MISTILAWLQAHNVVSAIVIFNIAMTAIANGFIALSKSEPAWLQTVGDWGVKIAQFLMANPPTPKP